MRELLVVVDMQYDFVSGPLGSKEAVAIVPNVKRLINLKRAQNAEVVFTQDTHGADYLKTQEGKLLPVPHCVKGEHGWEILNELKLPLEKTFEKGAFSSLALAEYVRGEKYEKITLCGVCTDICVVSNALLLKGYCPETPVHVIASACAGTSEQAHRAALSVMQSCQVIVEEI